MKTRVKFASQGCKRLRSGEQKTTVIYLKWTEYNSGYCRASETMPHCSDYFITTVDLSRACSDTFIHTGLSLQFSNMIKEYWEASWLKLNMFVFFISWVSVGFMNLWTNSTYSSVKILKIQGGALGIKGAEYFNIWGLHLKTYESMPNWNKTNFLQKAVINGNKWTNWFFYS